MSDENIKLPRLYVDDDLSAGKNFALPEAQAHYLKNVLRREAGAFLRLFNGRDGEWRAAITLIGKKECVVTPQTQLRAQPAPRDAIILVFCPVKKARLEWLIEKAAELGATHLFPVISRHTEVREINHERTLLQIREAAEQCERLDIPKLAAIQTLDSYLAARDKTLPLYACVERADAPWLGAALKPGPAAFLIGPEGGFNDDEANKLQNTPGIIPVSLGDAILRSETAACYALIAAAQRGWR